MKNYSIIKYVKLERIIYHSIKYKFFGSFRVFRYAKLYGVSFLAMCYFLLYKNIST